ncbi:MAG TPA: hypothetical protein VNH18_15540 [Bryobacteraceae bacterium]|jgi:hypothetical protein|nr:hypothetical protein [Bryobacteraceae bacterium]
MRRAFFISVILLVAHQSKAGPIAAQFGSGYEGVYWGTSLTKLVGMFPDGEHYFSTSPGERVYLVQNNYPIFDVPRTGTRVQYHLGKDGGVEYIAIGVPYERRDQLLGTLLSLFGSYSAPRTVGTAVIYHWPRDNQVTISVRASKDPTNGILEFWVSHVDTSKPTAPSPK